MKLKMQMIAGATAAWLVTGSAVADETTLKMDAPDVSQRHMNRANQLNGAVKASEVIGLEVQNYQHEKLGKVTDLTLDVPAGRVVQVLISTGGHMGMGSTLMAVPPGALHHDVANRVVHLNVSKEKLMAAPKFDNANWNDGMQFQRVSEVYGYYDEQPYFVTGHDEYWTNSLQGTVIGTFPRKLDGSINIVGARATDTAYNQETIRNWEATNGVIAARNADGTWSQGRSMNGGETVRLGYLQKASQLMGAQVNNLQDDKLGTVKDFAIDVAAGRIVAVIISSGRYMGMNGKWSAVPPTALRSNGDHDTLQLDMSRERLASSPTFTDEQWSELGQPAYVGEVYRTYKVEPYFTSDVPIATAAPVAADNTRRNVRDRNQRTVTPLDQGNNQADIDTTAQIRKEIMAGETMSTNAKNVKIITLDGHVTLRGAVNSESEKQLISEIADRSTHSGTVDNQLEVTTTNTSIN